MKYFYNYKINSKLFTIFEDNMAISKIFINDLNFKVENYSYKESETIYKTYKQLKDFFKGNLYRFSVPIAFSGTKFQKSVWQAIYNIPYGSTKSYKDIAIEIGNPRGVQAVGTAIGNNPIPIIIPCHRIIKSNGNIGYFKYGTDMKTYLLNLENKNRPL